MGALKKEKTTSGISAALEASNKITVKIETIPEDDLKVLKPLLSRLAMPENKQAKSEPLYIIETDLTPEEIAMVDERMKDYETNPESWVTLEDIKKRKKKRGANGRRQ